MHLCVNGQVQSLVYNKHTGRAFLYIQTNHRRAQRAKLAPTVERRGRIRHEINIMYYQETKNIAAVIKLLFLLPQVFCSELPVFMREHHNGMYRTDVYFLSKTLAEVPIFLIIPILFTSIMYYIVGLNPKFIHFLTAVLFITLVSLVAVSFGKSIARIPI